MRFRLNNKGNTLAIVLIGIFILSILGTLILGVTSTNYNMKVVEQKTEKTLYYAEKASDELYSIIGSEVMKCATDSYKYVLQNYIEKTGTTYNIKNKEDAMKDFEYYYYVGITGATDSGVKNLYYKDDGTNVAVILDRLSKDTSGNSIFNYPGYKISVVPISGTKVEYVENKDDDDNVIQIKNQDCLEEIRLLNVCVQCESINTGYYSSVTTDYTIKVPSVEMDFLSSNIDFDIGNLGSYALIAEGSDNNVPALNVNKNLDIAGNVYLGDYVDVNNNFTLNANLFYCNGDFNVNNANVAMGNKNVVSGNASNATINEKDSLQFYANNIVTKDTSNASVIDIRGNSVIKDDLEINGTNSSVKLSGNYFGYGFRGDKNNMVESNTYNNATQMTGFNELTVNPHEHESSSAMIINGNGADLNCLGLGKLVLAGRSYIDLDMTGSNKTYMTGESVSIKGNQRMYLANKELEGTYLEGKNPMIEADIGATIKYKPNGEPDIPSNVIAKYIGGDIKQLYFYLKTESPTQQTTNFRNRFAEDINSSSSILQEGVNKYGVKNILFKNDNSFNYYTVGAITEVEDGTLKTSLKDAYKGIDPTKCSKILNDIDKRVGYILPSLRNVNMETEYDLRLGEGFIDSSNIGFDTIDDLILPFNYYCKNDLNLNIQKSKKYEELMPNEDESDVLGEALPVGKHIGYCVATKNSQQTHTLELGKGDFDFDYGVVITNRPVVLYEDFEGLIITEKSVSFANDAKIKANQKLVKYMFENIQVLQDALNNSNYTGEVGAGVVVDDKEGIKYTDLVEKSNWRKNIN